MLETIEIQTTKVKESKINQVDFRNIQFGKVYSDHMFVADYKEGEWTDFRIIPFDYLRLSPANAAIHYGQSIFEGLKAYKGENDKALIFRPFKNFERMNRSAERMCMPYLPEEIFMGGMRELIKLDQAWIPDRSGTSLYIRPFMFATDEYIGVRPSDTYKFMIFTCPVGAYYMEPVKVKIETHYARAFEGGTGYAKAAGNYAAALYPAQKAQEQGYHQLIWTDSKTHTYIEESGTMNVMFLINNKLITAPVPTGGTILDGVTRDSVLHLAREWGYEVEERQVEVKEVIEAIKNGRLQEAFGTGTAATIAHISVIGYDGVDYELPDLATRKFSNRVLQELENIKTGKIADRFNWVEQF